MNINTHPEPATRHPFTSLPVGQGLYIGGSWRAAANGNTFQVLDPSTEASLAHVPDAPLEVAKAIQPTLNAPKPIVDSATAAVPTQTATTTTAPATA